MKKIQLVGENDKEKVRKYFIDYLLELSQFDPTIKFDKNKKPIYKWFDCYWEDKDRYPFLLSENNQFAGLALVRELEPKHFEIAEFYVLPKFRGKNNATMFAAEIINLFGGEFSFSTRLENLRAVKFWDKFVLNFPKHSSQISESYKEWSITTENLVDFE